MITLTREERQLLVEVLQAANNPESLASILPKADHIAAMTGITKQIILLQDDAPA